MTEKLKILAVDDDEEVRAFVRRVAEKHGMELTEAADAQGALDLLRSGGAGRFDAILLDVMMPGTSGWDLLVQLREAGNETPVIFLTSLGAVEERVKGLRLGADDYVIKPFEGSELIARVEAVVRRRRAMPMLEMGDLQVDLGRRRVTRAGERIDISPREFDLLRVLMEAGGRVLSRRELLRSVWAIDADTGTNIVEVQVARLRRKLDRKGRPMIRTEVGEGYRLVAGEPPPGPSS